jgi:hypothetical protein
MPADDPALTADLLDARLDLHGVISMLCGYYCYYLYRYTIRPRLRS